MGVQRIYGYAAEDVELYERGVSVDHDDSGGFASGTTSTSFGNLSAHS